MVQKKFDIYGANVKIAREVRVCVFMPPVEHTKESKNKQKQKINVTAVSMNVIGLYGRFFLTRFFFWETVYVERQKVVK